MPRIGKKQSKTNKQTTKLTIDSGVRDQETKKKTYEQSYGSGPASWDSYLFLMSSSSHSGSGASILSDHCFKVSLKVNSSLYR